MMKSEFAERVGIEPTDDEYLKIEDEYYSFDGDKDAFCEDFVKRGGIQNICKSRATENERLRSKILEIEKQLMREIKDRDRKIVELTEKLCGR